jgi:hypothetical protein
MYFKTDGNFPSVDTEDATEPTLETSSTTSPVEPSTSKIQLDWLKRVSGSGKTSLVTKTVTGFLDFVTTIGDTVLIFTPQITSTSSK